MSKYTTNFKNLIEGAFVTREDIEDIFKNYELTDYLTQDEIDVIEARGTWTKDKLAKKIVDHYYLKDLGLETYALFKHYAIIKMQEIMESKLPLIYSACIKYDPLVNVDFHERLTRNASANATSSGLSIASDTPQGNINKNDILSGRYATQTNGDESNGTTSEEESYDKHIKGNSGVTATAQKMVQLYRDNIRAIDYEIIKELKELFMGIY